MSTIPLREQPPQSVGMVKLADTLALGASAARREGSTPSPDTKHKHPTGTLRPRSSTDRMCPSEGQDAGSIPAEGTIKKLKIKT